MYVMPSDTRTALSWGVAFMLLSSAAPLRSWPFCDAEITEATFMAEALCKYAVAMLFE